MRLSRRRTLQLSTAAVLLPLGQSALAAMNVADAALWGPIIKEANIKIE